MKNILHLVFMITVMPSGCNSYNHSNEVNLHEHVHNHIQSSRVDDLSQISAYDYNDEYIIGDLACSLIPYDAKQCLLPLDYPRVPSDAIIIDCDVSDDFACFAIDHFRPLILTFETYKDDVDVCIWGSSNVMVGHRYELNPLYGTLRGTGYTKSFYTHFELDCNDNDIYGDSLYEDEYASEPNFVELRSGTQVCCYYPRKGIHKFKIRGIIPHLKAAYTFREGVDHYSFDLISVDQWGDTRWKSLEEFLGDSPSTTRASVVAKDVPNLQDVCSLSNMFIGVKDFDTPLEDWDTFHVSNMSGMFTDCTNLNVDLSHWDISSLRNAEDIFGNCWSEVICPKCDSFREKLYQESLNRPPDFDLKISDDLFRKDQAVNCKEYR